MADFHNPSLKRALAVGKSAQWMETVTQQAESTGYKVEFFGSGEEALKKMAAHQYEMVIVDEKVIMEDKRVLPYLVTIPMEIRRNTLYLISGARYKTMHARSAFSLGVDSVINHKDLSRLAVCLQALETEHSHLYREFLTFVD
jgi:CheY-like chemotaxis protein